MNGSIVTGVELSHIEPGGGGKEIHGVGHFWTFDQTTLIIVEMALTATRN